MAGDTITQNSVKEAWSDGNGKKDVTSVVPVANNTDANEDSLPNRPSGASNGRTSERSQPGTANRATVASRISKAFGVRDSSRWQRNSFLQSLGEGFQETLLEAMEVTTKTPTDKAEWFTICHPWTLIFRQTLDETTYIHCRSRQFSKAMVWPMFGLAMYSGYSCIWADWFSGTSYYTRWDEPALIAFNLTWMTLCACGTLLCIFLFFHGRGCWRETRTIEYAIGGFMCISFWPGIFFGNRWRCAQIFGVDAVTVFGKYDESDGDLMLLMDAIITFLGLFTPMRYITTVFLCLSMSLSYMISTGIAGTPEQDSNVFMSILIVTLCFAMALYQQYHTETYKRMKFFDIYREQRQVVAMSQARAVTQASGSGSQGLSKVTEDTDGNDEDEADEPKQE